MKATRLYIKSGFSRNNKDPDHLIKAIDEYEESRDWVFGDPKVILPNPRVQNTEFLTGPRSNLSNQPDSPGPRSTSLVPEN
jgi:hypothetical protein